MRRAEDRDQPLGEQLLEGAMVRMAAVAVIDIASGRIEALAGALSPCARQEVDGPGRDAACDTRLPYPVHYRADALLNPAVYHDAMPASTIKPIMATAFLSDPGAAAPAGSRAERAAMQKDGTPARDSLRGQLMRSDSARFLDRMFCSEQGFAGCRRPWEVQATARAFGWNAGCADDDASCGKADLLFGGPLGHDDERGSLAPGRDGGRLRPAAQRAGRQEARRADAPDAADVARRRHPAPLRRRRRRPPPQRRRLGEVPGRRGRRHRRRRLGPGPRARQRARRRRHDGDARRRGERQRAACRGRISSMRSTASPRRRPDAVAAASARWRAAPAPSPLAHDAAEVILSGLSYSHRAGTARTACEQVFDAKRCRDIDWLAGKTGTPSFPSDGLSLDELVRLCAPGAAPSPEASAAPAARCGPYKWYVAAWRGDRAKDGPWTKAIAVLTERNWLRASGRVHGAGDHGPNPAAEIAMQIVGRTTGAIDDAGTPSRSAVAKASATAPPRR